MASSDTSPSAWLARCKVTYVNNTRPKASVTRRHESMIGAQEASTPVAERLRGKIGIVTGAGSRGPGVGNGKAAAILMAREGARVLCVDAQKERAEETVGLIRAEHGDALAFA